LTTASGPRAQGFPDLVVEDYGGFAVKSGTPGEVVTRLNQAMNRALLKPKVREAFANLGAEPSGGTPGRIRSARRLASGALGGRQGLRNQDTVMVRQATVRMTSYMD
jgi:hypothetical protein